jgi:ABC-type amino acid transport system permease subunit
MADTVMIDGQAYLRRNPLGVVGLMFITLGIYALYWWWKINDELRLIQRDESISPTRSLMAMLFGWIIIVPPFIAAWNTAKHLDAFERRVGVLQTVEPVLVLALMVLLAIANGAYMQDHLNRGFDAAAGGASEGGGELPPPPHGQR